MNQKVVICVDVEIENWRQTPAKKSLSKKIFAGLSKGLFSLYSNHRLKMEMAMNFTKEISHRSCSIMSEFFFVQWQF